MAVSFLDLSRTRRWKLSLMFGAVAISVFFLWFTDYLVTQLSAKELGEVQNIARAFTELSTGDPTIDKTHILETIQSTTIPIIVLDEHDNINTFTNLDPEKESDTTWLRSQVRQMKFYNDPIPITIGPGIEHHVYFKEQYAITLLRYFPYVQLGLITLFLIISYVAFNASRMYEQNKVWVGMAKETAHQIGTPLSSLIAWVEYLRSTNEAPGEEILQELEKDIHRLEIITERFSKIGSTPELQKYNLYDSIDESVGYLKNRISNKVNIFITQDSEKNVNVMLNKNLFSWVIENLTKNAVDAMGGKGTVSYRITAKGKHVYLDVKDTGKGIPRANFKLVFKPGFTTRKRGWGLGLSLSKRIIENYHKGEIAVKESELGKGTTFRIKLNMAEGV